MMPMEIPNPLETLSPKHLKYIETGHPPFQEPQNVDRRNIPDPKPGRAGSGFNPEDENIEPGQKTHDLGRVLKPTDLRIKHPNLSSDKPLLPNSTGKNNEPNITNFNNNDLLNYQDPNKKPGILIGYQDARQKRSETGLPGKEFVTGNLPRIDQPKYAVAVKTYAGHMPKIDYGIGENWRKASESAFYFLGKTGKTTHKAFRPELYSGPMVEKGAPTGGGVGHGMPGKRRGKYDHEANHSEGNLNANNNNVSSDLNHNGNSNGNNDMILNGPQGQTEGFKKSKKSNSSSSNGKIKTYGKMPKITSQTISGELFEKDITKATDQGKHCQSQPMQSGNSSKGLMSQTHTGVLNSNSFPDRNDLEKQYNKPQKPILDHIHNQNNSNDVNFKFNQTNTNKNNRQNRPEIQPKSTINIIHKMATPELMYDMVDQPPQEYAFHNLKPAEKVKAPFKYTKNSISEVANGTHQPGVEAESITGKSFRNAAIEAEQMRRKNEWINSQSFLKSPAFKVAQANLIPGNHLRLDFAPIYTDEERKFASAVASEVEIPPNHLMDPIGWVKYMAGGNDTLSYCPPPGRGFVNMEHDPNSDQFLIDKVGTNKHERARCPEDPTRPDLMRLPLNLQLLARGIAEGANKNSSGSNKYNQLRLCRPRGAQTLNELRKDVLFNSPLGNNAHEMLTQLGHVGMPNLGQNSNSNSNSNLNNLDKNINDNSSSSPNFKSLRHGTVEYVPRLPPDGTPIGLDPPEMNSGESYAACNYSSARLKDKIFRSDPICTYYTTKTSTIVGEENVNQLKRSQSYPTVHSFASNSTVTKNSNNYPKITVDKSHPHYQFQKMNQIQQQTATLNSYSRGQSTRNGLPNKPLSLNPAALPAAGCTSMWPDNATISKRWQDHVKFFTRMEPGRNSGNVICPR